LWLGPEIGQVVKQTTIALWGGQKSTFSTNDRPRTRFLDVPGKRDSINEVAVAVVSRATMAHPVHILGNCEILLANEQEKKKGDAGKPALHETLVQMNKEWTGAVRDGREEMNSVASSCHQLSDVRQLSLLSRDSGHIKL
jgi:hypothetical protein